MEFNKGKIHHAYSEGVEKLVRKRCYCADTLVSLKSFVLKDCIDRIHTIQRINDTWFRDTDGTDWLLVYPVSEKQNRRMTNSELSRWLWEGVQKGEYRELKITFDKSNTCIYTCTYHQEDEADDPVPNFYKIRINGGNWREPEIEEYRL